MGGCSQSEGPACMMAVAAGLMKSQGERNLCRDSSDAPPQPEGGMEQQSVIWFDQIGIGDVAAAGGQHAPLGEMQMGRAAWWIIGGQKGDNPGGGGLEIKKKR